MPTVTELKENRITVNTKLGLHFQPTTIEKWFDRHTAVSAEDFVKEPHRNKLNVVISRTNHLANHIGQLLLLK